MDHLALAMWLHHTVGNIVALVLRSFTARPSLPHGTLLFRLWGPQVSLYGNFEPSAQKPTHLFTSGNSNALMMLYAVVQATNCSLAVHDSIHVLR
jgi:hypothetical protein